MQCHHVIFVSLALVVILGDVTRHVTCSESSDVSSSEEAWQRPDWSAYDDVIMEPKDLRSAGRRPNKYTKQTQRTYKRAGM
jgi:hypothetical protein